MPNPPMEAKVAVAVETKSRRFAVAMHAVRPRCHWLGRLNARAKLSFDRNVAAKSSEDNPLIVASTSSVDYNNSYCFVVTTFVVKIFSK